ncbi:hypothetical protein LTR37_000113 [Vermiconidia calcicola]|uniref:Uncharacterized protein n=1 Tax=Vermiconidia calcicola TaxID=1690605 RepID=A0ACC3NYY5_9PEZI|nr:hypothetical protein LTR37_000113 [Vermiconidia calcicola]
MGDTVSSVLADPDFGRLDYCVNCVGINSFSDGHYEDDSPNPTGTGSGQPNSIDSANYRANWTANLAYLNAMVQQQPLRSHDGIQARQQRGAVVNISRAFPSSTSKAATFALPRRDAIDYSQYNIRINCISPGLIDMFTTHQTTDGSSGAQPLVEQPLARRQGRPEEIADLSVFLCSTRASFVQGQCITADGGLDLMYE